MTIHPVAKATFLLAVALAAGAVLLWLAKRWRGTAAGDGYSPSESLTNFRELHSRGGLSDEEFRTIKSKLANQLNAELEGAQPDQPLEAQDPTQEEPKTG